MQQIEYPSAILTALDAVIDDMPRLEAVAFEDTFMAALHGALRGQLNNIVEVRRISAGYPALRAAVTGSLVVVH